MSQGHKQWKKPTDILRTSRLKSQKRRSEAAKRTEQYGAKSEKDTSDAGRSDGDLSRKRKNPFNISSPSSRRATESNRNTAVKQDDADVLAGSSGETKTPALFSALNRAERSQKRWQSPRKTKPTHVVPKKTETKWAVSTVTKSSKTSESAAESGGEYSAKDALEELPVDWSLKVRLRIVSRRALLPGRPNVSRTCKALTHFVHNAPMADTSTQTPESVSHALEQCCHYWVHPVLPGFPEFPRIVPNSTLRKQVKLEVGGQTELRREMYNNWFQCLDSVYHQLRTGHCPYFYLCCHHFTAVFWGASIGGCARVTACLTPTTRGLRQALHRERVDFTMPNQKESSTKRKSSPSTSGVQKPNTAQGSSGQADADVDEDQDDDDDITATDEGASQWLQDVGLDKKDFPTLAPSKVRIQREGYQQVDGRPESLVLCEGMAVHALFNFIITSKSITAATGPQAGIPPTILSPTAFVGGALKRNRIIQSKARLTSGTTTDIGHVVDINGPLLPHHILNICAVLQENKDECLRLSVSTHEPTVPLNFTRPSAASNTDSLGAASMPGSEGTPLAKPGGSGRGSLISTSTPISGGTPLECPGASDRGNLSSSSTPGTLGTPIINPATSGSDSLGASSMKDIEGEKPAADHDEASDESDTELFSNGSDSDIVGSDTDTVTDRSGDLSAGKMALLGLSFSRKDSSRRESSSSLADKSLISAGGGTQTSITGTPGGSTMEPMSTSDQANPGPSSTPGGQGGMSFSSPDIQGGLSAPSDPESVTSAGDGTQTSITKTPSSMGPMSTPGGQWGLSFSSFSVQGGRLGHVDRDSWEAALHRRVRRQLCEPSTLPASTALKEITCEDGKFWLSE